MKTKDAVYTAIRKVLNRYCGEPISSAPEQFGVSPEFIFDYMDGTAGLKTLNRETPMFVLRISRTEKDDTACILNIWARNTTAEIGDMIEFEFDTKAMISGYTACPSSYFVSTFEETKLFKRMQAIASFIEALVFYESPTEAG